MNSSDEAEAPVNRSEDAELVHIDPLSLERTLQIGANLFAKKKVRFNDFLSNNLEYSPGPPQIYRELTH